jgi:type VI secretion system (T6SS) phospholipase Tle1-like effector
MKRAIWIFLGMLAVLAAILACLCAILDCGGRIGALVGLMLGTLLGPARLIGVDFRQWFRDPGTPSEAGDDSCIGLLRDGFHALAGAGALAFVTLFATRSSWVPTSCSVFDVSAVSGMTPERLYLHAAGDLLGALLAACSGFWSAVKFAAGTLVGVVLMEGIVEITWRRGLVSGLPEPAHPREYLATQQPISLRPKAPHAGRRRLMICCDGTWNWPEPTRETNVVRLVRAITPDHGGIAQIVHYHEGVGTGNFVDRIVGGGAGVGLSASVKACYGFLVDNYREHDEIFLFGFSRGAFVARALGGLIGVIGIMRKHEMDRFSDVWNWYCQDEDRKDTAELDELAKDRYRDVDIECIGVWDTVGALGIPGTRFCAATYAFHDTELGPHVRHAFQALAIDEQRGNFQAAVWVPSDPNRRPGAAPKARQAPPPSTGQAGPQQQVLKQVWFPGVHSNIGGGYPEHGLSDATFLWMLSELQSLIGLDQRCILGALDTKPAERYPGGALQDSRSLFWKLIGCPVPRPVGITSPTERVHESAWERMNAAAVPAQDVYRSPSRTRWLAAMQPSCLARTPFEASIAALPRPPVPAHANIPKKLDWCRWLLQWVVPQG